MLYLVRSIAPFAAYRRKTHNVRTLPTLHPAAPHDYSIALCFELKRVSSSFQRDFIELVSQLGCGLDDTALVRSVSDAPHNLEVGRRRFLLVSGSIDETTPFRSVNVQFRGNNIQQR